MIDQRECVVTQTGTSLTLSQMKEAYDAEVKRFLQEKVILARILKGCVDEFRGSSLKDIEEKYIEGVPQVSSVAVDQDVLDPDLSEKGPERGSRIIGSSNEDSSIREGVVTYDIRFSAAAPKTGESIKLIVNVEAQRYSEKLSYPVVKRGLYYCARLLSAQKEVEFRKSHYEDLKKVYSIWICHGVPKDRELSIVSYDIMERVIAQKDRVRPEKKANYDLLTVILLGLGDPAVKEADETVRMLSIALSREWDADRKKRILSDEFGIRMSQTMERTVNEMCNLSDGVYEDGLEKGREEGMKEGALNAQKAIVLRMHEQGCSDSAIARMLGIEEDLAQEWIYSEAVPV